MRQRIARRKHGQRQRCANRLFQPSRTAQRAHQPVMRLHVLCVHGNGNAKSPGRLSRTACGQQSDAALRERIGSGIGKSHNSFQNKAERRR